jgi:hypothetical protein
VHRSSASNSCDGHTIKSLGGQRQRRSPRMNLHVECRLAHVSIEGDDVVDVRVEIRRRQVCAVSIFTIILQTDTYAFCPL